MSRTRESDMALMLCPSLAVLEREFGRAGVQAIAETIRLCSLWHDPRLLSVVDVRVSARARTSLGSAAAIPSHDGLLRFRISISRLALHRKRECLLETVCHEFAHVAAWREAMFAKRSIRPHGVEWQRLISLAGYPAHASTSCRASIRTSEQTTQSERQRRTNQFVHHACPVCHTSRLARKTVLQWRCASCVDAGLPGVLTITRPFRNK